jgi:hypothetical protein
MAHVSEVGLLGGIDEPGRDELDLTLSEPGGRVRDEAGDRPGGSPAGPGPWSSAASRCWIGSLYGAVAHCRPSLPTRSSPAPVSWIGRHRSLRCGKVPLMTDRPGGGPDDFDAFVLRSTRLWSRRGREWDQVCEQRGSVSTTIPTLPRPETSSIEHLDGAPTIKSGSSSSGADEAFRPATSRGVADMLPGDSQRCAEDRAAGRRGTRWRVVRRREPSGAFDNRLL